MIDLSFLTEAEQEAILKVLNRDSVLKKAEEQRVRRLQDKVDDENELKYKSGQWFYEAKSRRHRDKIHGADLVRASIRKRKKPATIAELGKSSKNRSQRSWVNSINQDIFIPPEQYGVMEPPDETEEDLMSTKAESNNSAKRVSFSSPDTDKGVLPNGTASPAKQRKNPFNSENPVDATDHNTEMSNQSPQDGQVNGQGRTKNIMSSIIKYGVRLPYAAPISDRQTAQEAEEDFSTKQPPVPKPRKLLINGGPPERSNSSLQREDSLNGTNKRRGILKRRSSSSSTDSESIRIPPNSEPMKLVLPASPILEAEQPHLFDDQVSSSESSPDRQKQVRFSEKVLQKPPTPNLESYNEREIDEFGILDPSSSQNELDYEMVDYHHYEEFKPNRYSYNSTEAVDQSSLEEKPTVQISLNSAPILDDEKKMEDRRREIMDDRIYDILDERPFEINIDSAGTEPFYAEVRKPSKSTSSDQEKDFAMEDALMEPRLLDQRGKTEKAYQREKSLEFGKSYGGGGKINYGSSYTINQPGNISTNEDILAPEQASNTRSSYNVYEDEPKPSIHDSDYFPKWRRPYTSENDDLLADRFVKPYPENRTNSKYSPGEHKTDTKYKTMFLKNTPEVEGRIAAPLSNFPVAQTVPLSSKPLSGEYQTREITLRDSPERRDLPKSANFKVLSLKDRIHDMPSEQMSNPSQFQSLKHFWNAEDKNWSKGDVATSPEKILTDVSKRNKPIRADFKQRNSKEIPVSDLSLPSSFDSLSEEEQTSQKVASWLAQTPVYGAEQLDADEDQVQPGKEVMENIDKTVINRKNQAEEFSSALQKLTDEAVETPKVTEPEYVKSKDKQISTFKESDLLDQKKNTTTFSVSSAEKKLPPTKFYERVVQISNTQSPAKETNTSPKQYPEEEIEESVERSVAPAKTANEFKIGFQKLMEEYESVPTKSDREHQEDPNSKGKEQQLIETEEIIDKSFVPKGNDHQEFIAALNRLKIEASTPSIIEDQDEQPETILMQNSASPVKSSFKIGFEHLMPAEEDTYESPQKSSVNYTVQSSPLYNEDTNGIEEVVEKTSAPSRVDENDLGTALKKLEQEAAAVDLSEPEDNYEKPKITPTLQSARSTSVVQSFEIPRSDIQNMTPSSDSMEKKSAFEDPLYSNRGKKSSVEAEDAYVTNAIPEKEKKKSFYGQGKLPVEEETIEKTIIDTEEGNADYKNRLMRLEEEAATSFPEEPEDLSVGDTFHVSPAPTKEVFISKKVFNNESMPIELPSSRGMPKDLSQPQPYAYKELANYPQSPSDQSGSFTGSAGNVLYKKPGSSEVSNSKQGKPALAGSPSDSSSSKDKYTIEVMKAQDESISKVLDWFSRSSDSVNDQMPSVGLLEESKTSPQKLITNADKLEDKASGQDVDNLVRESEATQQINPTPQMARNSESKEDMKTMDGDQPKIMNTNSLSLVEDEFVSPQQMPLKESLEFGKSGSGSGKLLHGSINEDSLQKYLQHPVEGEFEKGKESLTESLEFGKSGSGCGKIQSSSINDNPLQEYPPLDVEGVSETDKDSLTELLEYGKSERGCEKIQSSSVNDDSIQKHPHSPVGGVFEKDNLEAEKEQSSEMKEKIASSDEDDTGETPVGKVIELKEVLTSNLEQKDQSSKNIEKDISIIPRRRVSDIKLLWEGDGSSQDATKRPVLSNIENPLSPVKLSITPKSGSFDSDCPQEYPQLPVGGVCETDKERLTELLELGKSGSGCGKIQSSSSVNEDSLKKYPQFSMGGEFERDKISLEAEKEEGSELKHKVALLDEDDTGETPVGKVKDQTKFLIPTLEQSENKSLKNTGEDVATIPQTKASDVEPLREGNSPSQDVTISNVKHPFSPFELSTTPKSGSFSSNSPQKDPQLALGEVSGPEKESLTELLEFGNSGSGGGKLQSRSINDSPQKYPQLSQFENDNELLEAEKEESSVLKEKVASLDEDDTRETQVDKVKDQTKVLTPTLEQKDDQSSKKTEKDIAIIPQRRVSDIKLLWEGDKPSQDAPKKPVLSDIKRPSSPVESSITPKSDSFDSEDQNGASLVTFKKVIVEDEDDPISPLNQLKSFWENDTTKGKPDRQSMENENWTEHKGAPMVDPKSKSKTLHTIQTFFETEKSTDPKKDLPGRRVSLGESANESLKDRIKSTSFQSLKHFWNTSSKSDNKRNNQTLPENTTKQFGSNPDIRIKEPFILKAKSRLAATSLHDIRQDPSAVSQFQAYNAEPTSRKFSRGNSKKEDQQKSVNKTGINPSPTSGGNDNLEKPIRSVDVVLQKNLMPSNYQKYSSAADKREAKEGSGISDKKQRALTKVLENSVDPKKIAESETSLGLKTLQGGVLDKNINSPDEKPHSTTFENCPNDQSVYRDEENGEMNEKGRKMLLVKQNGFDVVSPVLSNVAEPLQENKKELSENDYFTGKDEPSDLREVVNENIEKTVIPLKNDPSDFDRKLQNLYNESLNTVDFKNGNLTTHEYMSIDEPAQTFSKVLAVSSGNIQSSGPYKDKQPIIINISSKKTEIGNEDITQPQQDNLTETSLIRLVHSNMPTALGQTVDLPSTDVTNITSEELASELKGSLSREPEVNEISSEPNDKDNAPQPEKLCKKEIIERIEMPVVLPKTRSSYFDEKLKQLYEESHNSQPNLEETADSVAENNEHAGVKSEANVYLYSSEPKKTFLKSSTVILESSQSISADRETLTDESAPSGSQAPDTLLQEVNETIEKTVAPKRISNAKSLEELQKEALNEEAGELVGNVSSGHMTLNESISKLNDQALRENSISETIPKEDPTLEGTEPDRYEKHEEGTPETSVTFMSDRQSTPVKDKNSSLRRSTLELYLEAPYRREISKSIDFNIFEYLPSDADKCTDKSNPVLSALKRSTAKTLNKAVLEVSPTSTNQNNLKNQKADTQGPTENSFPENAEKFKRMSQSVPAFIQDDTDGRETDSASESSFQIGRHKKSPSSLTNLSGSSGMASMSSVSGSVMSVYSGDFGNLDIKGSIEFATEYVQDLKEFNIFIYQCKDLAAADIKKQRSDPYVKVYLLPEKAKMGKRKSTVKKKTLNPVYNEILRYKIPKESLEAQTLNVSVWHHDVLGRNSFLGEVNVNLATWDWQNTQKNWYPLEARTPASGIGLVNRGEIRLSLKYIPMSSAEVGKKPNTTGEVQIWIKECIQLPMLRENKINAFVKCTILPDTSRKSRQKTRTVDKTPNPIFNHKMIYDGFKEDDLREACVELTVWDHNKLSNHFLGGIRIGFGTGKSYGTAVDWMDSSHEESTIWEKMITSPNTWIDGILPLRMFKMAKLAK